MALSVYRLACVSRQVSFSILQSRCINTPAKITSSCRGARSLYVCATHQRQRSINDTSVKTSHTEETVSKEDMIENNKPVRYTTSKAAQQWTVGHSFGKHRAKENSTKKVVAVCTVLLGLLAWVFLREETETDKLLRRDLHEVLGDRFPSGSKEAPSEK